jgi:4-hydroxy-tetrahydrodipicolinate synthase
VDLPIIIYNIPGRCVVQMQAETMAALHAECPNIVGVKQSVADMDALSAITALLPKESWRTWCGDDSLTLPMLSLGATGTISVSAHLVGKQMRDMIQAFKAGDHARALKLHCALLQVNRELFFLPNPTVVKSCLARLGLMEGTLRPPMVAPEGDEELRIQKLCSGLKHLIAVGA